LKVTSLFCRYPEITNSTVQHWQPYTANNRQYLKLSANGSTVERQLRANYAALWNDLLPSLISHDRPRTGCGPVAAVSTVIGMWSLLAATLILLALVAVLTVLLIRREMMARRRRRHGLAVTVASKSSPNNYCSTPK